MAKDLMIIFLAGALSLGAFYHHRARRDIGALKADQAVLQAEYDSLAERMAGMGQAKEEVIQRLNEDIAKLRKELAARNGQLAKARAHIGQLDEQYKCVATENRKLCDRINRGVALE